MKSYFYIFLFSTVLFTGCANKILHKSQSATIILKTPTMKFYDMGFINIYDKYIQLQIFNIGQVVLDLKVYKDEVCQGRFECMSASKFNSLYLSKTYSDSFLYDLLKQDYVRFKDKENNIFIKIIKK